MNKDLCVVTGFRQRRPQLLTCSSSDCDFEKSLLSDLHKRTDCPKKLTEFQTEVAPETFDLKISFNIFGKPKHVIAWQQSIVKERAAM